MLDHELCCPLFGITSSVTLFVISQEKSRPHNSSQNEFPLPRSESHFTDRSTRVSSNVPRARDRRDELLETRFPPPEAVPRPAVAVGDEGDDAEQAEDPEEGEGEVLVDAEGGGALVVGAQPVVHLVRVGHVLGEAAVRLERGEDGETRIGDERNDEFRL